MQTNIYKINVTRLQYNDVSAQYYIFSTLIVYYTATFALLIF